MARGSTGEFRAFLLTTYSQESRGRSWERHESRSALDERQRNHAEPIRATGCV